MVLFASTFGNITGYSEIYHREIFSGEGIRVNAADNDKSSPIIDITGCLLQALTKDWKREIPSIDLVAIKSLLCIVVSDISRPLAGSALTFKVIQSFYKFSFVSVGKVQDILGLILEVCAGPN